MSYTVVGQLQIEIIFYFGFLIVSVVKCITYNAKRYFFPSCHFYLVPEKKPCQGYFQILLSNILLVLCRIICYSVLEATSVESPRVGCSASSEFHCFRLTCNKVANSPLVLCYCHYVRKCTRRNISDTVTRDNSQFRALMQAIHRQ